MCDELLHLRWMRLVNQAHSPLTPVFGAPSRRPRAHQLAPDRRRLRSKWDGGAGEVTRLLYSVPPSSVHMRGFLEFFFFPYPNNPHHPQSASLLFDKTVSFSAGCFAVALFCLCREVDANDPFQRARRFFPPAPSSRPQRVIGGRSRGWRGRDSRGGARRRERLRVFPLSFLGAHVR